MILTTEQLTDIIKTRPNKGLVKEVQEYSALLTMHMTGKGLSKYIEKLDFFEKKKLYELRLKYTKSNKHIFSRLHRPIDKIFSATGGSSYYDLPDRMQNDLKDRLKDVEWGHKLREWMNTFWRPVMHYDPMGLIHIEVDSNGDAYPTYKSSGLVYDYKLNGRQPEYIIYSLSKNDSEQYIEAEDEKVYRVVDDAFDYLVKWDGSTLTTIEDSTYPNYFGKVPAWIVSDIYDTQKGYYISPDDDVIEIADQYLREGGVLDIYKYRHGYPRSWSYTGVCRTCKGTGSIDANNCTSCNGTGKTTESNISEDVYMNVPTNGEPVLAPPIGVVEAAVSTWDKMDDALNALFDAMYMVKWGSPPKGQSNGISNTSEKTATEIIVNEQPKIEKLFEYCKSAERTETMIVDYLGIFYYGNSYKGAYINYGRRFIMSSADQIMGELTNLIEKEAPYEIIREKMQEYYHSLYQSDSQRLTIALKLIDVEPLPFYSLTKAQLVLPEEDYYAKLNYVKWRAEQSTKDILLTATAEELRTSLYNYSKVNQIQ